MKSTVSSIVVTVIVILVSTWAYAAPPSQAGRVAVLRGTVSAVSEGGQTRTLAAKSPVFVNDTITTAKDGQVQILFADETVYTLGPNSDLRIDKFVYDPDKGTGDIVVGATKGSFRMITGSIAKKTPEKVKVKTPVATIGIRGTYLAGLFSGEGLRTLLVGGAIMVENQGGGRNIRTPGFGTLVKSANAAPEAPSKFTAQQIDQVLAPTELKPMAGGAPPQGSSQPPTGTMGGQPAPEGTMPPQGEGGEPMMLAKNGDPMAPPPPDGQAPPPDGTMPPPPTGDPMAPSPPDSMKTGMMPPPPDGDPMAPPPPDGMNVGTMPPPPDGMATGFMPPPPKGDPMAPPPPPPTGDPMLAFAPLSGDMGGFLPPPPPPGGFMDPMMPYMPPPDQLVIDGNQLDNFVELEGTAQPTYSVTGRYLAEDGGIVTGTLTGSATGNSRTYTLSRGGFGDEPVSLDGPVINLTLNPFIRQEGFNFPGQTLWSVGYPGVGSLNEFDGRGEFGYFESSAGNLLMGYAGRPSIAALPVSGIGVYKGVVGFLGSDGKQDAKDMTLFVNWATGKVFGNFSEDMEAQTFYKGTVDIANKQLTGGVLGKNIAGSPTDFHESAGPFIFNFYGGLNQGIGAVGSGVEKNYLGNNLGITFSSLAAAVGNPVQYTLLRPATETYKGFVAAISVPRATPSDMAMLVNTNPSDVTLNLDRVNGTVDGSFNNAAGVNRLTAKIHTINSTFGAGGSVYIDDDAFVNTGVSSSGNVTTVGPASSVSNVAAGNFVVTNPTLWNPIPYDHLTWGYWASEYKTVAGGITTYYNITPGSYWIAGLLTPNINLPAGGTGTYTGHAMGQAYNSLSQQFYSITGTSNLTADFGARTLNGNLNMSSNAGGLNRTDWTINLSGSWPAATNVITGVGPSGATGSVTPYAGGVAGPSTAVVGSMNGAFFDTNAGSAKAVGGNWQAGGGNHSATGIFVGK